MDAKETVLSDYKAYIAEIELYDKEARDWVDRSKKIVKRYKDADNKEGKQKRFNILWSNVQTLSPALYARDPQPEVERRFKDSDPVGRVASEVIERCLSYTLDQDNFGNKMRQGVLDRLLPGRGVLWARYEPTFESVQETNDVEPYDNLTYEKACTDYVYWQDFGHAKARTWEEVPFVWRRVYMKRAKLVERFGKKLGSEIPLDSAPEGLDKEKTPETLKSACIYEIWDRVKGRIVFLSKAYPKIIERGELPLDLTGGFPCPRPLFGTITTDSLIPTPDFVLYQTQAMEIEDMTARINMLQKALRVVGVYDSSTEQLARILGDGYENKMVPIENWAAFAEKGGLTGGVDFLPIKEIAETLIALYEAREKSKADLYEITGIADIIRGNSDPRETAAAQQMKGRFAVLRISDAQDDVQRFARDTLRLLAEIIAENFGLETIKKISGVELMTNDQKQAVQQQQYVAQMSGQQAPIDERTQRLLSEPSWEDVYALMSDQVLRGFRINVETDSTIRTDEDADRQERTEFLTAAGTYIRSAIEGAQMVPELAPLMGELLMFAVRGHKAARQIEPVFEDALAEMKKPKPPKPDPEMQKLQAQTDMKIKELQAHVGIKQEEAKIDAQVEREKQHAQSQEEMARQQLEDQRAERDAQREERLARLEANQALIMNREKAQIEADAKIKVARETASLRNQAN